MPANVSRRALLNQPLDHLLTALQEPADTDRRVFPKLFPNPTGQNGWEDFVLAGDLLHGIDLVNQAQERDATLTLRRILIGHPMVRRALGLVRSGLAKNLVSPYGDWNAVTFEMPFSQFAMLRNLARVLAIEQQVLFADGRPAGATDAFRVAMRLAEVSKSEALIGGLVGVACGAIAMARCIRHLDALPQRECDALAAFLRQYLASEDRATLGLARERQLLDRVVADLDTALDAAVGEPDGDDATAEQQYESRRLKQELEAIKESPARRAELVRDLRTRFDQHFQRIQAQLAAPWDERLAAPVDDSLAGRLAARFLPQFGPVFDKFVESRTQALLLLGHTLIRRFRWEIDRLPESMDELKVGDALADPFTRKPLVYKKLSATAYDLESVGPILRDDAGNPIPGQRRAIHLPYRRS